LNSFLLQHKEKFFCGISGEPPQDAVVSAKSGHVYERCLILKYIHDNGTDPLTGEKLEESDLLTIKAGGSLESHVLNALTPFYSVPDPKAAPPQPPAAPSIPVLLQTLKTNGMPLSWRLLLSNSNTITLDKNLVTPSTLKMPRAE